MSLPLYFVLCMNSRALVFLVYNKWSHECFCDLPQSASISTKRLQLATRNAIYGKLSEFHPEAESISAYLERVELFFMANSIADDKKVAVFLSVIEGKTYSLLRDLLAPEKPHDKSLSVFIKLKEHYEPKPLVITERFYFHRRDQGANESIAEYIAELRCLAISCEFGKYLNDALRDRLVCGLRNTGIQKRLLSEASLTLAKAGEIAQGMEAAEKNAKRLQG